MECGGSQMGGEHCQGRGVECVVLGLQSAHGVANFTCSAAGSQGAQAGLEAGGSRPGEGVWGRLQPALLGRGPPGNLEELVGNGDC